MFNFSSTTFDNFSFKTLQRYIVFITKVYDGIFRNEMLVMFKILSLY